MTLTPTRRMSGRYGVTVPIVYDLGSQDMAAALALGTEPDAVLGDIDAHTAEARIHSALATVPDAVYDWPAGNTNVKPETVTWAAAQIRRLWPDLDDDALTAFEQQFTERTPS